MIPLSNGRSPRIDQFYATLRTFKSHQNFEQGSDNSHLDEDDSILMIRSLGEQILNDKKNRKVSSISIQQEITQSVQIAKKIQKRENLYDKYKMQNNKKTQRQIMKVRQNLKLNALQTSISKINLQEKQKEIQKHKKMYPQVKSKLTQKINRVNTLNYSKNIDNQKQKMRKQQRLFQQSNKTLKNNQLSYTMSKANIISHSNSCVLQPSKSGLLKRTKQLEIRKQITKQKISFENLQKQRKELTFHPNITSKKSLNIKQNFRQRQSLANLRKLHNSQQILKQVYCEHSFSPATNSYRKAESKIDKIWKGQKVWKQKKNNFFRIEELKSEQTQQTAHTSNEIYIKNLNQVSFVYE